MHYRTTRHNRCILRTGESFDRLKEFDAGFWGTRIAQIGLFHSMLNLLFEIKDFSKRERDDQRHFVRLQLGETRHQILEPALTKSLPYVPFIDSCVNLALAIGELSAALDIDLFTFGSFNSVSLIGWENNDSIVEVTYARLENVND